MKWHKGKTLDLNVKINMDAWRQRLDVSSQINKCNYWCKVGNKITTVSDPVED